jgi:hypothetical protein
MLAVSRAQLYLTLPTSHDAATIAVRTVVRGFLCIVRDEILIQSQDIKDICPYMARKWHRFREGSWGKGSATMDLNRLFGAGLARIAAKTQQL